MMLVPICTKKIQDKSDYYQVEVTTVFSFFNTGIKACAVGKSRKVLAVMMLDLQRKQVSYGIEEEDMICLRKDCTKSERTFGKESKEVVACKRVGLDV